MTFRQYWRSGKIGYAHKSSQRSLLGTTLMYVIHGRVSGDQKQYDRGEPSDNLN